MFARLQLTKISRKTIAALGHKNISNYRMEGNSTPVETAIRNKLAAQLEPVDLDVINESYMHNVPKGSETHFKVVVVSSKFKGLSLLERHRIVNGILKEELATNVHALSIVTKTPDMPKTAIEPSPTCRGGFGK